MIPDEVLGNFEVGDGFTKKDGAFVTAATFAAGTPVLKIEAQVAIGRLKLSTTRACGPEAR